MTTKVITFLVGDPYKPSFATVTVRGPHPRYNIFILKKSETKSHQRSNIDVDTVLVDTMSWADDFKRKQCFVGPCSKKIIQSHTFGIWFGGFKKSVFMTGLGR